MPSIADRGAPRIILVPHHSLVHLPHWGLARVLSVGSHNRHRSHDIFPRHGRLAGVRADFFDFHGGIVSLPTPTFYDR